MNNPTTVQVLVSREDVKPGHSVWVAQCLEYDLAAQGPTLPALFNELQRTLIAHIACAEIENMVPFECLKPAPATTGTGRLEIGSASDKSPGGTICD